MLERIVSHHRARRMFASLFPGSHTEQTDAPEVPAGRYRRWFAIHEIEASRPLQWLCAALLLSFFVTFHEWAQSSELTARTAAAGEHQCWPYFQSCARFYVLDALPRAYSQTILYTILFVSLIVAAFALWRRSFVVVHALMLGMFAWKALVVFVLTTAYTANFHYFHLLFVFLLLFARHKLFFLRRTFVLLYFLAGLIKLDNGWVLGTYFTSLQAGLPLVPDATTPFATNAVIALELLGGSFLLSRHRGRQRVALAAFLLFHVYSAILVNYRYPTMVMGPLLCLFGPWIERVESPFDRKAVLGWFVLVGLVCAQAVSFVIPGDANVTLEGNYFGVFMFEANHQCRSRTRIHHTDGETDRWRSVDRTHAHNRCDPYAKWFRIQQLCKDPRIASVEWTFDHSVNGGPLRRIVDERDACALAYDPWRHNAWIRTEREAPVVGTPVKNIY